MHIPSRISWQWILVLALGQLTLTLPVLARMVADDYAPQVGSLHPDFTLPTIDDGRPVSLAQFRGQKVLLIQFASW
jgi:hypothetical protein